VEKARCATPAAQAGASSATQDEHVRADPPEQTERQELVATAKALSKAREDAPGRYCAAYGGGCGGSVG
jgi:hypothetical protein